MTHPQAQIAIIGGGPSGLTLARLLELSNIAYVVFERDESATWADENQSSGTLDIHSDSGQVALQEAGLLEQFRDFARYGVPTKIVDSQGKVHTEFSAEGDEDKPEIDRKDLRNLLLASVPGRKVRWGYKAQHLQKDSKGLVSVHFTNGCVESGFRLVVGADGAWSKARNMITSARPKYSGTHFFSGYIKPDNPIYSSTVSMAGKGNYLAMTEKRQIFLHYLGDGSYHLAVGLRLPEDWASKGAMFHDPSTLWQSCLQTEFTGWASELTDLIKYGDGNFRSWPLFYMPTTCVPWEHTTGVTLVGDAAHLTIPAGDGVNNAMYDSLELARSIVKHGIDDLASAVANYEKAILPRAVAAIEKGQWFTDHFFGADAPEDFLRAVGAVTAST